MNRNAYIAEARNPMSYDDKETQATLKPLFFLMSSQMCKVSTLTLNPIYVQRHSGNCRVYKNNDLSMLVEDNDRLQELRLLNNESLFNDQWSFKTSGTAMDKNIQHVCQHIHGSFGGWIPT